MVPGCWPTRCDSPVRISWGTRSDGYTCRSRSSGPYSAAAEHRDDGARAMLVLLIIAGTICCVTYFAHRHARDGGASGETALLQREVAGLHQDLDGVRQELADLAERLDFAERMLAQQRGGGRVRATAGGGGDFW